MDQEAWNQIYADLEKDIAALKQRGGTISELDVVLGIDKARFAMDRGDTEEAIARIQELKRQLRGPDVATTRSAPAIPGSPALDRLDALEDNLHTQTRLGSARLEIVGEDEEPELETTRSASANTKVNRSIKYEDTKDEYLKLWNACRIRPEKASSVRREADRLLANRKVYEEIQEETSVPWWFIGLLHQMECSYSLSKHLHNGDSLKARTWQVPAGRPKEGSPPFTFVDSAIDALEVDGFAGKTDWPLALVLWRMERYNGFGYRKKFGFASPYLWSFTNHFSAGKYVKDGVFDPNAPSKQCGTAATLRDLMERGLVSFDEKKPDVVATAPKPTPTPTVVSTPATTPASTPVPEPKPAAAPVPTTTPTPTPVPSPVAQPTATTAGTPVATPAPGPQPAPVVQAPKPTETPSTPTPLPVEKPAASPAPLPQPSAGTPAQAASASVKPMPIQPAPSAPTDTAQAQPVAQPAPNEPAAPIPKPASTPTPTPVAATPQNAPTPSAAPVTPISPPSAPVQQPAATPAAKPAETVAPTPTQTAKPEPAPGVSSAVAAALAELARRGR